MNELSLLTGADTKAGKIYSNDVFSAYTRTGTGADVTVTTDIDMTKGYMLWSKSRSAATDHAVYTSATGVTNDLVTNTTGAVTVQTTGLKSVSSTGHTIGALGKMNTSAATYVDWIFRKAPKFFDVVTYTGNGASSRQISHGLGDVPGMIIVKSTSTANDWVVYARKDSTNYSKLYLHTTGAGSDLVISSNASSSTFKVGVGEWLQNANGETYVAYLFAHDPSTDGIIQCGSFTTDGTWNTQVNTGFEPQFVIAKRVDAVEDWLMTDTMRGFNVTEAKGLRPNTSTAEDGNFNATLNSTGFKKYGAAGATYIYLTIRRQNKPPTIGTQVYNAIARTGTGAAATVTGVGFAPDLLITYCRNATTSQGVWDKLRGGDKPLITSGVLAEQSPTATSLTSLDMNGITVGTDSSGFINNSSSPYINHFFKRAPGVLDQICYTGTGTNKTEFHNLTVVPELWLIKSRSAATQWVWGSTLLSNTEKINMPTVTGRITDTTSWNSTSPTSTTISLGTSTDVNASAATYVAYLWASKVGVSKVFSYIGNGTSQVINCGFTTGARYIMIIRTNSGVAQDIFVFDSGRGILSSNDPHLSINTTAAEVTTDDSVDPDLTGFSINQNAVTNINVLNATYIGLSYA